MKNSMEALMKISRQLAGAFLLLSSATLTSAALADDNCQAVKDAVRAQYPAPHNVIVTGSCGWSTPADADNVAYADCLVANWEGASPFPQDRGHREVVNWLHDFPYVNKRTYLDYCVEIKGTAPMLDPSKAEALRQQIDQMHKR
jgi:hypothetical protein